MKKDKIISLIGILCLVLFFGLVSFFSPLSPTDDLYFKKLASDPDNNIINHAILYGNGRFLGNITAMLMANNLFFRTIFRPFIMAGIVLLLWSIFEIKDIVSRLFIIVMISILPSTLFAQTITWTGGFANYFPPVFLFFLCLYLVLHTNNSYSKIKSSHNIFYYIMLCLFSISAQLYIEHMSFAIVIGSFILLLYFNGNKNNRLACIVWSISSFIGFLLMLYIQNINYKGSYVEKYRDIPHNIAALSSRFIHNFNNITLSFFTNCRVYFLIMFLITVLVCEKKQYRKKNLLYCLIIISTLYSIFIARFIDIFIFQLIFFVTTYWCIFTLWNQQHFNKKTLFSIITGIISILPMQFISPYGDRCLLFLYIGLIILLAQILNDNLRILEKLCPRKILYKICIIFTIVNICLIMTDIIKLHNVFMFNQKNIKDGMKNHLYTIDIKNMHSPYFHTSVGGGMEFNYYYNQKGDITFNIIDDD